MVEPFEIPPHSEESECAVLGTVLHDPSAAHLLSVCPPDTFYSPRNADVARACQSLGARRESIDIVAANRELVAMKRANAVGLNYLAELTDYRTSESSALDHAHHVNALARRRNLGVVLRRATELVYSNEGRYETVADDVLSKVMAATERREESAPVRMIDLVDQELKRLEQGGASAAVRYPSGLKDLDRLLVPMEGGQLILVGGRPSAGKTSLVMRLAQSIATLGGHVLVFSLETTDDRLTRRQLASQSTVPLRAISDGKLTQPQFGELQRAAQRLSLLPVWIDDGYGLTLSQLRSKVQRHRARHGVGAIVVDYIQLLMPEAGMGGGRAGSREQEVAALSRGLKRLAKEFDVPVLALSQLNRASELRENKRPTLADLRDSGQLEQDADAVLLAYALNPERTRVGVVVAKQKDGAVGEAALGFDPERTAFRDLTESELEEVQRPEAQPSQPSSSARTGGRAAPRRGSFGPLRAVASPYAYDSSEPEPPPFNPETDSDFNAS